MLQPSSHLIHLKRQIYAPILKDHSILLSKLGKPVEELGIINQKGLSRKVRVPFPY